MELHERIRYLRKEILNMTQEEFGEKLGVSRDVVNNLERGRVEIKDDRIKLICSVFDIRTEWMIDGELPMEKVKVEFGDICREIGVNDPKARQAILDYYELSPSDKELFWKFVEKFMK